MRAEHRRSCRPEVAELAAKVGARLYGPAPT